MIRDFLLRLYPAAWRREYGEEFADVLASRPVTFRTVANVLANAAWQRLRSAPLWLYSGGLQIFLFVTLTLVQMFGLLSWQDGGRLMMAVSILLQAGTGFLIGMRRNGGIRSGMAGTTLAALVACAPLIAVMLLVSPPSDFPNRTLMIQMSRTSAVRLFFFTLDYAALCGLVGAICGSMTKRFRGRFA